MDVRRVVTGHDPDGKAIVVGDDVVAPLTLDALPGSAFHWLWGSDGVTALPDDGARPKARKYFPPPGGSRFGFFTVPPDREGVAPPDLDPVAAMVQFERRLPGLAQHFDPDDPGMHTTATVDYGVVLSGEAVLELDDGVTVTLAAGDTFIQNGTRHRWSNVGDVPAVIAVTYIGADHDRVG
jgi:mannose-6-phosphate isomerase-like protein (cupin superfamily)